MRAVPLAVLLAGCISIPAPAPTCDPGEDEDSDGWKCDDPLPDCNDSNSDVNPGAVETSVDVDDRDCFDSTGNFLEGVTVEAGSSVVTTGGFALHLAGSIPSSLTYLGTELLSSSAIEGGIGLSFYPVFTTTGGDGLSGVAPDDRSPVMVEMQVGLDVTDAGGSGAGFAGTVFFHVYPDGRIIRHDHRIHPTQMLPDVPVNYFVSTYQSFDGSAFDFALSSDAPATPIPVPNPATATSFAVLQPNSMDHWTCIYNDFTERAIAMSTIAALGDGLRVTFGDDRRIAMEYDWYRDESGGIPTADLDAVSLVQLMAREQPCSGMDDIVARFQHHAAIAVTAPGRFIETSQDDQNGDGYWATDGLYAIDGGVGARSAELRFLEPVHGVAIRAWLDGDGFAGVTVWRDGARIAAGRDYLIDIEPGFGTSIDVMIWLPGDLPADTRIRIASPRGEPL